MAKKYQMTAGITRQEEIATDIYSMWLDCPQIAKEAKPGQFLALYSSDKSRMLPRPISICEIDTENGRLHIVYRIAGAGTREFSVLKAGQTVTILGPLGNGFPEVSKRALIVGGGIGIPPMLGVAEKLECEKTICLGFRDERFLVEEFEKCGSVCIATEDGSFGTKGNVLNAIRENKLEADVILACGPTPMLRALKEYAAEKHIECYVSLEEKMACGIGACLACVCKSTGVDEHTNVNNKRICKEGPVFLAGDVEF